MIFIQLFIEFFKVGLFSVGGGLATLPFLYNLSDTFHWFTHSDIANMIAIAESTPGAIGVNMSTYAGYNVAGVAGGILSTLGLITPSIIVILMIAKLLDKYNDNKYVQSAFFGLRPASLAMIAAAGVSVVKVALIDLEAFQISGQMVDLFILPSILFAVVLYFLSKKTSWHPILLIGIGAIVGIVFQFAGV